MVIRREQSNQIFSFIQSNFPPPQIKAHENIVVYTYMKATYQLRYPFLGGVEGYGKKVFVFQSPNGKIRFLL
jgi:hypothetical protein